MYKIFLQGPRDGEFYAQIRKKSTKMYEKVHFFCPKTTLNGYTGRNMHEWENIKADLDSPIQVLSKPVLAIASRIIRCFAIDV